MQASDLSDNTCHLLKCKQKIIILPMNYKYRQDHRITFRLQTDEESIRFKELVERSGQSRSELLRCLIMSYTPPPTAIDLEAYITLLKIKSSLEELASDLADEATISRLGEVRDRAEELAIKIVRTSNAIARRTK